MGSGFHVLKKMPGMNAPVLKVRPKPWHSNPQAASKGFRFTDFDVVSLNDKKNYRY
jgi:hypothetical protein